jgi:hypothetical protein
MRRLKIYCESTKYVFHVTKREALELELRLNAHDRGREWAYLGDILYTYHSSLSDVTIVKQMNVTPEQYELLYFFYANPNAK